MAEGSDHRLRSSANLSLSIPPHKRRSYNKSFTVYSVRLWNALPAPLRQCRSVASLKANVKKLWLSHP
jgi:hypothetical protein